MHTEETLLARARSGGGMRMRTVLAIAVTLGAMAETILTPGADAVVPGPNGRIVWEGSVATTPDIFTMNPDGTAIVNLTNHPAIDVFPAWSADSSKITFASDRHEAGNQDVYVMNADGTGVTQLTNSPGEDRGTSWTSDGEKIVFHTARNRTSTSHFFDIYTMNPDGTDQTLLHQNGSAAHACGDSETGTVVFNSASDPLGTNPPSATDSDGDPIYDFEIFTIDLTGANLRQITFNNVLDSGPKWSPDCSMISYNSLDAGSSLDVHRINGDGTGDVNLTNAPGVFDAFSAWSPDGASVVFSSDRADANFELFSMSAADGSGVQRLTFNGTDSTDLRADWGSAPLAAVGPLTPADCRDEKWRDYESPRRFRNQGDCTSHTVANAGTPLS